MTAVRWTFALSCLGLAPGGLAGPPVSSAQVLALEIPHRAGMLAVDGRLDDWRDEAALRIEYTEPELKPPLGNHTIARVVWDERALWVAFEVRDSDLVAAPEGLESSQVFQFDSVEVYLDARADGGPRMRADDVQLLVALGGAKAMLEGDELIAQAPGVRVPKRFRSGAGFRAATREVEGGWLAELEIPWPLLGMERAAPGMELGLGLATNDWLFDHAPFAMREPDLASLAGIAASGSTDAGGPEPSLRGSGYWPWSWTEGRDYGYPDQWRRVVLMEAGAASSGPRGAVWFALAASMLGVAVLATVALARRRRAAMLERVGRPAGNDGFRQGAPALDEPVPAAGMIDDDPAAVFAQRAAAAVEARLARSITPAELAAALHVSLRTLQRRLAEAPACTPSELIDSVKMRHARKMLEEGELTVREIAERVGFGDPGHFSRRFRAHWGLPPSSLRNGD
ncbi:MAG: helix-turn-helix domain-containing protein [Xanthomonadales bacterium]|nr:helix-turn-helix domain-containing protein [Xanthomonadales bacterium]